MFPRDGIVIYVQLTQIVKRAFAWSCLVGVYLPSHCRHSFVCSPWQVLATLPPVLESLDSFLYQQAETMTRIHETGLSVTDVDLLLFLSKMASKYWKLWTSFICSLLCRSPFCFSPSRDEWINQCQCHCCYPWCCAGFLAKYVLQWVLFVQPAIK